VEERELALGYRPGATMAAGNTNEERFVLLGRCIDLHTLVGVLCICKAWCKKSSPDGLAICCNASASPSVVESAPATPLAVIAEGQDSHECDIWSDADTLHYLEHGEFAPHLSALDRSRVSKRLKYYVIINHVLYRVMADGSHRVVPPITDRESIVAKMHAENGHFGIKRTVHLVATNFWWRTMRHDVAVHVRDCSLCQRAKCSFNSQQPTLTPLEISGVMYRWGCDLCGPFVETPRGNKYVMVCIEYYTKNVELIPIPCKTAAMTAYTLAHNVIGRYGAPAEIVTDSGSEWSAEFEDLLVRCMIDHRKASPGHPQADGLAERAVQTLKRGLRKLREGHEHGGWDLQVPWIALGYRCSPQASTGFTPYLLTYGVEPTLPPAIKVRLMEPICFEDVKLAAKELQMRAAAMRERYAIAGDNLKIAQHMDTLRYAHTRSGIYLPVLKKFVVGDLVYVKVKPKTTLNMKARPVVLRVHTAPNSVGVLTLVGRCGSLVKVRVDDVAPCHLTNVHDEIDESCVGEDLSCVSCGLPDHEELMLLCDCCGLPYHTYCLEPALPTVPRGKWFCPDCKEVVVTNVVTNSNTVLVPLPDQWDLCTADGVEAALERLMPGKRLRSA
jgi:hypothetical protein